MANNIFFYLLASRSSNSLQPPNQQQHHRIFVFLTALTDICHRDQSQNRHRHHQYEQDETLKFKKVNKLKYIMQSIRLIPLLFMSICSRITRSIQSASRLDAASQFSPIKSTQRHSLFSQIDKIKFFLNWYTPAEYLSESRPNSMHKILFSFSISSTDILLLKSVKWSIPPEFGLCF